MEKMNLKINVPEVDKNEFVYEVRNIFSDEAVINVMISWFHEVYQATYSDKMTAEILKHEEMLNRFLEANEDNKPVMDYYNENINN